MEKQYLKIELEISRNLFIKPATKSHGIDWYKVPVVGKKC